MYLMVDGNNLAYRCFFAQMELMTLAGKRTGLIHGFFKSIAGARHTTAVSLEKTCIFWDGGRSKRRLELYPDYKQGRKTDNPQTEQDIERIASLRSQMATVKAMLKHRPVRQIEVAGVEADDMIALLARTTAEPVIILSGDKDFHQLVGGNNVHILDPKDGLLDKSKICEYWGLPEFDAERLLLLRSLQGDKSDGVKGIPGVGEVRALAVLPFIKMEDGVLTQIGSPPTPALQKLVTKVLEGNHLDKDEKEIKNQDVVRRNIELMRLPLDWESTWYEPSQVESALEQFQTVPESDYGGFKKFLDENELAEILDHLERH